MGEFNTPRDFLQSELNPIIDVENNIREYTEAYVIPATAHEDRKAEEGAKKELKKIILFLVLIVPELFNLP